MKIVDKNGKRIKDPDLQNGYLSKMHVIKDSAVHPDDKVKFVYDEDDYELVNMYFPYADGERENLQLGVDAVKRDSQIEKAAIMFVRKTAQNLSDDEVLSVSTLFKHWTPDEHYVKSDVRIYGIDIYRCLQDHDGQTSWTPDQAHSLWVRIRPEGEICEWERVQPGINEPYSKDDRVTWKGKTWISDINDNVWEPGVYGWTEVDLSPEDQYHEYVVGKSYYKGDKITYGGERYECIYTEGLPCVWSPTDYPAGWKKVQ